MSDDKDEKVANLDNQKQSKDPKQAALNKLKEAIAKEYNVKIDSQVKKTVDAIKIAKNEKKALAELIADQKDATAEFSDLLREI